MGGMDHGSHGSHGSHGGHGGGVMGQPAGLEVGDQEHPVGATLVRPGDVAWVQDDDLEEGRARPALMACVHNGHRDIR